MRPAFLRLSVEASLAKAGGAFQRSLWAAPQGMDPRKTAGVSRALEAVDSLGPVCPSQAGTAGQGCTSPWRLGFTGPRSPATPALGSRLVPEVWQRAGRAPGSGLAWEPWWRGQAGEKWGLLAGQDPSGPGGIFCCRGEVPIAIVQQAQLQRPSSVASLIFIQDTSPVASGRGLHGRPECGAGGARGLVEQHVLPAAWSHQVRGSLPR